MGLAVAKIGLLGAVLVPRLALVRTVRPVVDHGPAVAELGALAQVVVQLIQDVHAVLELPHRVLADRGLQLLLDVAAVRHGGAQLVVRDLHPLVEQVRDGRRAVGRPLALRLLEKLRLVGYGVFVVRSPAVAVR